VFDCGFTMKGAFVTFLGLFAIFGACHAVVDVAVFYEALCGDSYRFVINQLYPNYADLADYIRLEFVPFGKAEVSSQEFKILWPRVKRYCSCSIYNIEVMSCVLANLDSQDVEMEYVRCQMQWPWEMTGEVCATAAGVSWATVQECVTSGQGTELQLAAEERQTNALGGFIQFVPTQVFNDVSGQFFENFVAFCKFWNFVLFRISTKLCKIDR
jgi:Gamma interferon inducible lysosomal thiol reductase (GILT)